MSNCTHEAADPEMCIMCLRGERDTFEAKLAEAQARAETAETHVASLQKDYAQLRAKLDDWSDNQQLIIGGYVRAVEERDGELSRLRAKLEASERANSKRYEVLLEAKQYVLDLPLEGTLTMAARIDAALSSDAGRDYVPRVEYDAVMKTLRETDEDIRLNYIPRSDLKDERLVGWRKGMTDAAAEVDTVAAKEKILAARDAKKESLGVG